MKRTEDPVQTKTIDIRHITEEDLKALKKKDPFLYYSVPGVHAATLRSKKVVMSSLGGGGSPRRRRTSCPGRIESTPNTKIERKNCISFEACADLLLDLEDWSLEGDTDLESLAICNESTPNTKIERKNCTSSEACADLLLDMEDWSLEGDNVMENLETYNELLRHGKQ